MGFHPLRLPLSKLQFPGPPIHCFWHALGLSFGISHSLSLPSLGFLFTGPLLFRPATQLASKSLGFPHTEPATLSLPL